MGLTLLRFLGLRDTLHVLSTIGTRAYPDTSSPLSLRRRFLRELSGAIVSVSILSGLRVSNLPIAQASAKKNPLSLSHRELQKGEITTFALQVATRPDVKQMLAEHNLNLALVQQCKLDHLLIVFECALEF